MRPQLDGASLLDASANGKATLATSRRSFIAGWKLCAGVALGLCLAERSSSAQTRGGTGPCVTSACTRSCFLAGTRIKTTAGEITIEDLRIGDNVLTTSGGGLCYNFVTGGRTNDNRVENATAAS